MKTKYFITLSSGWILLLLTVNFTPSFLEDKIGSFIFFTPLIGFALSILFMPLDKKFEERVMKYVLLIGLNLINGFTLLLVFGLLSIGLFGMPAQG